jgi:hypothetical protein
MWSEKFNLSIARGNVPKTMSLAFSFELWKERGMSHLRGSSETFEWSPTGEGDFTFAQGSNYSILPMNMFPDVKPSKIPKESEDEDKEFWRLRQTSLFFESHGYALVCRELKDIESGITYTNILDKCDCDETYTDPVFLSISEADEDFNVGGCYDYASVVIEFDENYRDKRGRLDIFFTGSVRRLSVILGSEEECNIAIRIFGDIERVRYCKGTYWDGINSQFPSLYDYGDDYEEEIDESEFQKWSKLPREVDLTALDDEEVKSCVSAHESHYQSVGRKIHCIKQRLVRQFFLGKNSESKHWSFDARVTSFGCHGDDALVEIRDLVWLLQKSQRETEEYSKSLEVYQVSPSSIDEVKFTLPRGLTLKDIRDN